MKKIIFPIVLVVLVAAAIGYYMFNKPHRDVASERAIYTFEDQQLNQLLSKNFDSAFSVMGDQPIEVSGEIKSIEGDHNNLIVLNGVVVQLQDNQPAVLIGDHVTIKARLTGFDDLFMEAKLDQGTIQPKNE